MSQQQIESVIRGRAAALQAGDVKAMLAYYAPTFVEFSLAPPLRSRTDSSDPGPTTAWLSGFEAPPQRAVTELEITAGDSVAFATSLDSMTATPRGATEPFTLWYRMTVGLRLIDGEWLITHEHESVPFAMDGSLRALTDLEP